MDTVVNSNSASVDTSMTVASPCIAVCKLNDDDLCIGCYRTRDEIARWRSASDSERQAIINEATARSANIA